MESNSMRRHRPIFLILIVSLLPGVLGQVIPEEAHLASRLLDNGYSTVARPVLNQEHTITVKIDLAIINLLDMDEANQIMTANTYMTQEWHDAFLTWEPSMFWNITDIQIPIDNIWKPDIILHNNANDELNGGIRWTHAWIRYDGTVSWKTNYILMSACPMNPLYFPFDTQNCSLKLGSWTYNRDEIDVIVNGTSGDATQYQPNGEWDLKEFPVVRHVEVRECCPGVYPSVTFSVILKRQFMFYFFNLVIPCVIISSLVLLGFVLPSDACERITLTLTILLSLTVFLLLVAETMPPTSEVVPLISQYFAAIIVAVGLITFFAVVTISIHHTGDSQRAPRIVRKAILGILARFLCVQAIPYDGDDDDDPKQSSHKRRGEVEGSGVLNPVFEDDDGNGDPFQASTSTSHGDPIEVLMTKISRGVAHFAKLTFENAESKRTSMEWMHIASVLDRFFTYFFAILCLSITLATIVAAAAQA
nr:neuronal acetylcholine receptor subunit alpha-10-like [Lytechinus pictus]